jgi:hypothetical protein
MPWLDSTWTHTILDFISAIGILVTIYYQVKIHRKLKGPDK